MEEVHIVTLDYSNNAVHFYTVPMERCTDEDVLLWLETNTDYYNEATCYFMCNKDPIKINFNF